MPAHSPPARLLTPCQVAAYLGHAETEFVSLLPGLFAVGFPAALPVLCRWDVRAIDRWLDRMGGVAPVAAGQPAGMPVAHIPRKARYRPAKPEVPAGRSLDPEITVEQVLDRYLTWFRGHRITYKNSRYYADAYLNPEFGSLRVVDLTADHIRAWLTKFTETPRRFRGTRTNPVVYSTAPFDDEARRRKRNTANRLLSTLKAALNHAFREGLVADDSAWRRVRPYPRALVGPGTALTLAQCRLLVAHCPPDFKKLVKAALFCGARLSELKRIKGEDVDLAIGTLAIYDGKQRTYRFLTLTEEAKGFFAEAVASCPPDAPLLLRADGKPWNETDPYPRLAFACQNAGIARITFHQLRHTYASLLAMQGTPMAVIARCLGHSTTRTVERTYAHLTENYVADTVRALMPQLEI